MASVASTTITAPAPLPLIQPGKRLFTAADLAVMPTYLPSGSVSFELHHGRLVALSPPDARHGNLQSRICAVLSFETELIGKSYAKVGIVLKRNPDHVVSADNAFITSRSLPARESSEGYLETTPELVVEIRSKNDTAAEIATKVSDYLTAGVQLVWVVDPSAEAVTEHRPNAEPKDYLKTDSLACDDIIPGFRLPLAELFRA